MLIFRTRRPFRETFRIRIIGPAKAFFAPVELEGYADPATLREHIQFADRERLSLVALPVSGEPSYSGGQFEGFYTSNGFIPCTLPDDRIRRMSRAEIADLKKRIHYAAQFEHAEQFAQLLEHIDRIRS